MSHFTRERQVFADEFKREAVLLARERGNVEEAARELGIHSGLIHSWKKRLATIPRALWPVEWLIRLEHDERTGRH